MRPTREGRHTPLRSGLVTVGIGVDPGTVTEDPEEPTDRASSGAATIPYLPPPEVGPTEDLNRAHGTNSDGGGTQAVTNPTHANDNNISTLAGRNSFFNGGGTKTWYLKADLGSAREVDEIIVYGGWGNAGENDPTWQLWWSDDGSSWTAASYSYSFDGTTNPCTAVLTLAASQTRRYWRLGQDITFSGFIYPLKVHTWEINGPSSVSPSNVLWIDAPLTVDEDDATFEVTTDDSVAAADDLAFWRGDLGDSYLIASLTAEIGFETSGSVAVELQGANESDYSDTVSIATDTLTATGSFTADSVAMSWTPTAVYRYWQLLIDTADGVHIFEVSLFDPPEFTGSHEDLAGRDAADQHPADAVSVSPTVAGESDVQAALEALLVLIGTGDFETFDGGGNPEVDDHGGVGVGATETIDAANGNHHRLILDVNCTITVAPFSDGSIEVVVYQDGSGGNTITWSGVDFGGADDQPDTTALAATVYTFLSDDGTIYGFKAGGGANALTVEDDGTPLATAADTLDFVGAGVTATGTGTEKTITIPGVTEASVRDAGRWEVVVFGSPPEPVTNPADDDYVYAWVTG